jgi:hypothetical protein
MHHEYFENIRLRLESGSNIEGQLDDALNMYRIRVMHFLITRKKRETWLQTLHQKKKVYATTLSI